MKLGGYLTVAMLVLAVGFSGTAQEPPRTVKPAVGCAGSKEKIAGIQVHAESRFVPVRSTTGDLNADENDEEIVLARYVGRSGPRPDEILVYEVDGGVVKLMTRLQVGRAGEYVLSIKSFNSNFRVESGLLVIDVAVLGDKKAEPPKLFRTVAYLWNGKELVESDRSEPKPLAEHMREIG